MDGKRTTAIVVILLCALGSLAGCQSSGLADDNKQLLSQNHQLRTALDQERAQRQAAQAGLAQTQAQLAAMAGNPPQVMATVTESPLASANSAFNGVPGVETGRSANGNVFVRVPGDVLFASGQADLKESATRTIAQIAAILDRDYAGRNVRIEGYTDSDPIHQSRWLDNLELSLHRAAAVERELASRGVDPSRMYSAGFGPANPRPTKTQSRRVEIVVVMNE